jgi:hypothetical protein
MIGYQLFAEWQNPLVQSRILTTFATEKGYEDLLWQEPVTEHYFALVSFGKSVKKYFSKEENSHFLSYKNENQWLKLNLFTGLDYAKNYYFTYHGMKLEGQLNKYLFFYTDWWKGHIAGYDDMEDALNSPLIDSWYQTSDDKKKIYLDNLKARMLFQSDFGDYAIGREKKSIGNNIGGSIILNDACNEYGFLSANWQLGNFDISLLHATLLPDSTIAEPQKLNDKFLATHVLFWKINRKWEVFLGEHIVYGNRNLDLNYLLPLSFYRIIEHNLSDRDNALIFGGIHFKLEKYILYSNFIFDEFKKSEIFGNWWGNKYAAQFGATFFSEHFINRFGIEATAIRPWLYTHYILENKFSHDGISLGFPEGSNLIQTAAEVELALRKNLIFRTHFSYTVQGSLGNSFTINYNDRPKDTAKWLEGSKTDTKKLVATLDWQPLTHHRLKIGNILAKNNSRKLKNEIQFGYFTQF